MTFLKNLLSDEEGQDLVEYGLLISFVSIMAILALTTIGTKVSGYFTNATNQLPGS